ncbi:MAG: 3-hydroxybutyryl-CoA dehydrogenase [candidate division Zixibacteria bacterium 4484_95]|nr:MAG: 3-hydroxybutyryl-CoA dehydrogenase [candidate division Zixibacteria bacterium 4484_95]
MNIKDVAVIGGGTMGNGIAHVFAQNGFEILLVDVKSEYLDRALAQIQKNLERQAKKGTIPHTTISKTMARINPTVKLEEVEKADLVVEAIFENIAIKKEIFQRLDGICPEHTILASNSSSLPITAIASATKRPSKVIGMHFMNPVPMMKLVELIRGIATSDDTFNIIKDLCLKLDKTPVEVNDYPGYISNRLLMPMINEAIYCLMEGIAKAEDIDTVMKLGMNHPMGPLTLADFIGLDVCLAIMEALYEGYADSKYRPCPLLKRMVQAGYLGKKTGRGFYNYQK